VSTRLILNPVSGADDALPQLLHLNERLRARFGHLDIALTAGPGDAERAGHRAARDGGLVVVGGGDGTLNEVLNGVHRGDGFDRVRIGLLPLGTGNDFASALGIPGDLDGALDVLAAGDERLVDVGCANDRVFVNVSAGGFVAEVSDAVTPGLKTVAGRLAYLLGGAQVLLTWDAVPTEFASDGPVEVVAAGGPLGTNGFLGGRRDTQLFAVCNSRLIGGGRPIAPHAVIDDGWLDLCVVDAMPVPEFVALLGQVAAGEHLSDPRVGYARVRNLRIDFERPLKVNVDGQVFEASSCRYGVRPRAARFIAPANGSGTSSRGERLR
jgi:diacylglycerol kinase (ATP)